MADLSPRVAVAGLGGFAGAHHAALEALEAQGLCRVVATCDPNLAAMEPEIARFRLVERDVQTSASLDAMLDLKPDVVTLPTPIPLHAEQHAAVVGAGAACYLEKPPTLWWPEFQAMRTVERKAARDTGVGFNFIGDPFRRRLKARILAGEFGRLRGASLLGVWPRDAAYFGRNGWAGRLKAGDRWVLDSCIGNAMAHYVQNLLFWCGEDLDSVGRIEEVQARLGRAHPIESYDTAFVAARLAGDVRLRIAATHAGEATFDQEILQLDAALIVLDSWRTARIKWRDGRRETLESDIPDHAAMLRENLGAHLKGNRPATRLDDCESFVALCDLALVSSGAIHDLPAHADVEGRRTVDGLEAALRAFVQNESWPGSLPPPAQPSDLARLEAVATRLR